MNNRSFGVGILGLPIAESSALFVSPAKVLPLDYYYSKEESARKDRGLNTEYCTSLLTGGPITSHQGQSVLVFGVAQLH